MASNKEYQMLFQLSASMGGGFSSTFSAGQKAVNQLQEQINALNRTQSDISAYQRQQAALDKSKEKLALYQSQLERLKSVEASSANEAAHLANEIEAKQNQVNNAQAAVDKNNEKLSNMGAALREAGVDTNNLAEESARLKAEAEGVATAQMKEAQAAEEAGKSFQESMEGLKAGLEAVGAAKGLQALYNALSDCSQQAAVFETSMANVKRTVGGDDSYISDLGESFKQLSTEMPITAAELAAIASTAGQLGIAQENVEQFTLVMAQLATTTDLTADNAATMLAQFANITGTTDYDRLGATVAKLGDSTATTASKVVEMSQGMAAAASIAGMSETDILAISAAVGSLGIEAASGSTSMSQLITTLYKATETGENLESFASVAGMSAAQFKQAWGTDAVGAMNAFIQGLNDTERNGKSAVVILDELGISNVRQTKAILGLASAGDLLSNTIAQANGAWESNSALAEKAGVMYNTTESKMAMLQNAANNVSIAVGDALNPALQAGADALTGLVQPVAEFIQQNPAIVQAITTFAGVLGIAVTGISAYTAATKLAAAASKLFAGSIPGIGPILAVAGVLGTLVGVVSAISAANNDAGISFEELKSEYENLQESLDDNQHMIDLVDQYERLAKEAEKFKNLDAGDVKLKAKIESSGLTADNLKMIDELKKRIDSETGEIKQILEVSGADEISAEDLQTIIDLANASTDGDHELKQKLALLGADDISDDDIARLKALANSVVTKSGTLSETLVLNGFENYDNMKAILDLPISSKTAQIMVDLQANGYEDVKKKLEELGAGVLSAQQDVDTAEAELAALESQAQALQATIDATRNNKKKNQLKEELEGVTQQIDDQKEKVSALQEAHEDLVKQYDETATAAAELKQHEEQLKATQQALGLSAEESAKPMSEQLEIIKEQIKAQENLNKAKQAELNMKAMAAIGSQMVTYAQTMREFNEASAEAAGAVNALGNVDSPDTLKSRLLELYDAMTSIVDSDSYDFGDWDSESLTAYRKEFESLMEAATGSGYMLTYGRLMDTTRENIEGLAISETALANNTVDVGKAMEDSAAQAEAHKAALDEFVAGVVSMIESGVDAGEAQRVMNAAMIASGQDTALVAEVMDQANAILEEHAKAAEEAAKAEKELAEGTEETTATTEQQRRTIDEIITDINDLNKAYEEAYKSAYDSMTGQFNLFEKVKQVSGKGSNVNGRGNNNSYVKGLQSQTEYIEQYTANYEAAAAKLQEAETAIYGEGASHDTSSSLLSQLADGSAESAQILADLAAAAPEDVQTLVTEYEKSKTAADEFAAKVAETETNFNTTMENLKKEISEAAQAMDFSTEASANATNSLEAFIAAADGYIGKAYAAYKKVAMAAALGLQFNPTFPGHASGTDAAEQGFALVGEEGPELVYFNGGEKVLNNHDTEEALQLKANPLQAEQLQPNGSGSGGNTYQLTVTIPEINAAGMDPEALKDMITNDLRPELEDLLEEIALDKKRREY